MTEAEILRAGLKKILVWMQGFKSLPEASTDVIKRKCRETLRKAGRARRTGLSLLCEECGGACMNISDQSGVFGECINSRCKLHEQLQGWKSGKWVSIPKELIPPEIKRLGQLFKLFNGAVVTKVDQQARTITVETKQ